MVMKTTNLRHTRKLTFGVDKRGQGYNHLIFDFLVQNCDPTRLISFSVHSIIVSYGLKLVVEKLPNIRNLDLQGIVQARLDLLSQLQFLETLSLDRCGVTDCQVQKICELKNLRVLRLKDIFHMAKLTSQSLEYICHLTKLKELVLNMEYAFAEKDSLCRTIRKLPNLVQLEIRHSNIDVNLFKYAPLQALENLNISQSKLSGLVLPSIFKFHTLKKLDLSECNEFCDQHLSTIYRLHQLEQLGLDGS